MDTTTATQELPEGATLIIELNPEGEYVLTVEFWLKDSMKVPHLPKPIPQLVRIVCTGGRIERIIKPGDEAGLEFSAHGDVIRDTSGTFPGTV